MINVLLGAICIMAACLNIQFFPKALNIGAFVFSGALGLMLLWKGVFR